MHLSVIFTFLETTGISTSYWSSYKYYIILYNTIQYYTILYNTIYYIILYNTIQYYTILYNTIQYYTILYNTIQYYTILYIITINFVNICVEFSINILMTLKLKTC